MIISHPHLCTHLSVWTPKYNNKSLTKDYGEPVALLHKKKVDFSTGTIIMEFPKAKHLEGQRFAIKKQFAQRHAIGTNGKAQMYEVPMSHFESWISGAEVLQEVEAIWPTPTTS